MQRGGHFQITCSIFDKREKDKLYKTAFSKFFFFPLGFCCKYVVIMCPAIMEGSWAELCETEAIKAARVFAQTYHSYLASQEANGQTSEPDPEPSRVGQLFIEHFQEHFELELRRATIVINGDARVTPAEPAFSANGHTHIPNGTPPLSNGNSSQDLSREGSLGRNEPPPPAPPSFANRVRNRQADLPRKHSFRFWDKTSNIFEKFRRQGRARVANATNPDDVLREGHVSVMTGDDRLWDRSRLMLVKKESGYMLEFFSPPKVGRLPVVQCINFLNCLQYLLNRHVYSMIV